MNLTREGLERYAEQCGIPDYMHDSLVEYILTGRPVGNFLTAVLTNNLREACNRADDTNKHLLYEYVFFLYNYAPAGCWGDEERMVGWINHRGMEWNQGGDSGSER